MELPMSDPKRLVLDSPDEVERVLLRAARVAVPVEVKERAFVVACAALPSSSVAASVPESGTARAERAGEGVLASLRFVGAVVLAGVAAAVVVARLERRRDVAAPVAMERIEPAPPAPPGSSEPALPEPNPTEGTVASDVPAMPVRALPSDVLPSKAPPRAGAARRTPEHLTPPDPPPPRGQSGSSLSDQIAMLDDARTALSGSPAKTLSILDEYARRFPGGAMAPEATLLRIEALVKSGDRPAAARLTESLHADDPHSPYRTRVHSLLDGDKE
jgi:hypothetical protein